MTILEHVEQLARRRVVSRLQLREDLWFTLRCEVANQVRVQAGFYPTLTDTLLFEAMLVQRRRPTR